MLCFIASLAWLSSTSQALCQSSSWSTFQTQPRHHLLQGAFLDLAVDKMPLLYSQKFLRLPQLTEFNVTTQPVPPSGHALSEGTPTPVHPAMVQGLAAKCVNVCVRV